ncbi:MAG: hypothetical protein WCP06_12580 [Verrucomicrobiota bacterium]
MANEWEIKSRGNRCSVTDREFADGEHFYALLYRERGSGFRREDLCEEAWQQRDPKKPPFSFWRTKFELRVPDTSAALAKATAEDLLRHYLQEPGDQHANVRYILALMLERKRTLKPIETKEDNGQRLLIYEHRGSGEVFVILDPRLKLDQIEAVQMEVAELLG